MNPPILMFPHEPFEPTKIDPSFEEEFKAARVIGFKSIFYDHEAWEKGQTEEAFSQVEPHHSGDSLLFRGWMVPGEIYRSGFKTLTSKGLFPIVSPEAYEEAHYLPLAYRHTKTEGPKAEWIEGDQPDEAWMLYQGFRQKDCIIKDWVKSAKSQWKNGCYIPAGTSEARFREIFRIFRETRGKLFNRGVVLREFMPIVERGSSLAGLPVIEETRLFFWQGKILVPPNETSPSPLDEKNRWQRIAGRFLSPFMTIDVALLEDGSWKVVEVGDGGVSGLPMGLDPERFFSALWNATLTRPTTRPTPS